MSTDKDTKPLRGVFYARKSNDDGTDSVDQQRDWARSAVIKENITLLNEFTDQGISGQDTARRKDFHAMLKFCQEQDRKGTPVDVVVLWHPNRFSRADSHETSWFIWEFRRVGVHRMFSASHGWRDFRKMEHRLLGLIEQDTSYNPFARDLAQGALRGHVARALEGRWQGGTIPLGYRLTYEEIVYKGKKRRVPMGFIVDEDTAPLVREIFRRYLEPAGSLTSICDWLNQSGIRAPRRAALWSTQTLRHILTNERYLGHALYGVSSSGKFFTVVNLEVCERPEGMRRILRDNKKAVRKELAHEPLIDPDTFRQVAEKLSRQRPGHDTRGKGRAFRLAGLLFCGACQARMVGRYLHNRRLRPGGADRFTYCCGSYARTGSCHYNHIDEEKLLRAIGAKVRQKLPPLLEDLRRQIRLQAEDQSRGEQSTLAQTRQSLIQLDAKIDRASHRLATEEERFLPGIRKELDRLLAQRKQTEQELQTASRLPVDLEDAESHVQEALALIGQLDDVLMGEDASAVRVALAAIVERVEVYFDHETRGEQTFCTFARALVFFNPAIISDTQSGVSS